MSVVFVHKNASVEKGNKLNDYQLPKKELFMSLVV